MLLLFSHFPAMQFCAVFSIPAFSNPAFFLAPHFHVSHFQSPRSYLLTWCIKHHYPLTWYRICWSRIFVDIILLMHIIIIVNNNNPTVPFWRFLCAIPLFSASAHSFHVITDVDLTMSSSFPVQRMCYYSAHGEKSCKSVAAFLADRTAARSMIGYGHDTIVCLSVCLSVHPFVTLCIVAICGAQCRCMGWKLYRRVSRRALPIHLFIQFCYSVSFII